MRKFSIAIIFLFLTILTSSSIAGSLYPEWILPELRRYPIDEYLFDVGYSNGTSEEAYKKALVEANKKVSTKILKQVVGIISLNKGHVNYQTVLEHYCAVLEDYCSWHLVSPALQLKGLKHRNLSVDNARSEQETYAIVYIERDKLKDIYKDQILELQRNINKHLKMAQSADSDLDIDRTTRNYLRTYPLYESLKEAQIILLGLEYAYDPSNAFSKLVRSATITNENHNRWSHKQVIKRVEKLQQNSIGNFNELCKVIDSQLSQQINSPNRKVSFYPLMYEDSEFISPFALKFTEVLTQEMPEWVFVDPMLELKQEPINIDRFNQGIPPLKFSASCWENGNGITIRATLRNINTGEFLASSVVEFLKTDMRDNIIYQPRSYDDNRKEKDVFNPRYFVIEHPRGNDGDVIEHEFPPIGGLTVDLWTDKGQGPLSYIEDDKVTVYACVNQPAYLRLLNTHDNQKRALLVDNFYIGPEDVNKNVELGRFICTPPFGFEFFNIAARTKEFPNIETYEENDYHYLVEENAEKAAELHRGFKPISKEENAQHIFGAKPIIDDQPSFQQSEAQLVITTMGK